MESPQFKNEGVRKEANKEDSIASLASVINVPGSDTEVGTFDEKIKEKLTEMAMEVINNVNEGVGKKLNWSIEFFPPKTDDGMKRIRASVLEGHANSSLYWDDMKVAQAAGLQSRRGADNTEINNFIADRELERQGNLKIYTEGWANLALNKSEGTIQVSIKSDGYSLKSQGSINFDELVSYIKEKV